MISCSWNRHNSGLFGVAILVFLNDIRFVVVVLWGIPDLDLK